MLVLSLVYTKIPLSDVTMAEPADYVAKDKPGWMNGEHVELIPAMRLRSSLKECV